MLNAFITLDLPLDASDQMIRDRYLALVKQFPPEKAPDRFHVINTAYESIKDKRTRVKTRMFAALKSFNYEEELRRLADEVKARKKKTTLTEILQTSKDLYS
ncbi:MAG: hypothetical protein R6U68_06400 [Desulfobacteraceae bacterium]